MFPIGWGFFGNLTAGNKKRRGAHGAPPFLSVNVKKSDSQIVAHRFARAAVPGRAPVPDREIPGTVYLILVNL